MTLEADLRVGGITWRTIGADRAALPLMLRVPTLHGSLDPLTGDTVALGELAAKTLVRTVGDRVGARLPDGRITTLRVVAIVADGFGSIGLYVPHSVLAGHVGDRDATAV